MSSQTIAEAFAPAEARYRSQVMAATWGHLAPRKNRTYTGSITFAIGIFGSDNLNPMPIACKFVDDKGEELDGSPWFYDHMSEYLSKFACEDTERKEGHVYRFEGTFRNYKFQGLITKLKIGV